MKQVKDNGEHKYNDNDFTKHGAFLNNDLESYYTNSIMRKQPNRFGFTWSIVWPLKCEVRINLVLLPVWLVLEYALFSLGLWQLERSNEKLVLQQQLETQRTQQPVKLVTGDEKVVDYQPVIFTGESQPELMVYVANEPHKGQDGYHILNLIRLANNRAVWINRGWVKALPDRRYLPEVSSLPATWRAHGIAYYSKGEPVLFEHALTEVSQNQWVIQALSFDLLSQVSATRNQDVLPYIIRLAPDASHGFVREWQWLSMSPEKHIAYAIQWFGLAIALLVLGGFVSIRKQSKQ